MVQKIWSIDGIDRLSIVLSLAFIAVSFAVVNLGLKEFHLWPQVEYIYEQLDGIGWQQFYQHPHAHRYQLVGWIYTLSEYTGINRHLLFANFSVLILTLVSVLTTRIIAWRAQTQKTGLLLLCCIAYFFPLALFMNGRLVLGLLGVVMLMQLVRSFPVHHINRHSRFTIALFFFLTLLLSGVTSGVFLSVAVAAFSAVLYAFVRNVLVYRWQLNWPMFIGLGVVGMLFLPIAHMMLFKNLTYFNNDIMQAAEHGLGQIITQGLTFTYKQMLLNFLWACGCAVMLIYFIFVRSKDNMFYQFDNMLLITMLVVITLSIFAYSIASMSVVFSFCISMIIIARLSKLWRLYV